MEDLVRRNVTDLMSRSPRSQAEIGILEVASQVGLIEASQLLVKVVPHQHQRSGDRRPRSNDVHRPYLGRCSFCGVIDDVELIAAGQAAGSPSGSPLARLTPLTTR
jgi:hypothetical protein